MICCLVFNKEFDIKSFMTIGGSPCRTYFWYTIPWQKLIRIKIWNLGLWLMKLISLGSVVSRVFSTMKSFRLDSPPTRISMLLSFSHYSQEIISRLGRASLSSRVFVATPNSTQVVWRGVGRGKLRVAKGKRVGVWGWYIGTGQG